LAGNVAAHNDQATDRMPNARCKATLRSPGLQAGCQLRSNPIRGGDWCAHGCHQLSTAPGRWMNRIRFQLGTEGESELDLSTAVVGCAPADLIIR
jgi:hypothetical protein